MVGADAGNQAPELLKIGTGSSFAGILGYRFNVSNSDATQTPENQIVSLTHEGDIAVVSIDDGKANAVGHAFVDQFNEALTAAEEASALVVVGRPGKFSAGFDLSVMKESPESAIELTLRGAELGIDLFNWKRPVVFGVTGHALAMGAVLLCCADLRVGSIGDFKIGYNEVAIGLAMPEFAQILSEARLAKTAVHPAIALAKIYDPAGALEAGFLDEIVASEEVVGLAKDRAIELAKYLDPRAFAGTRRSMRGEITERLRKSLEL